MTLIDFTLSNAGRFYSSMGNPLTVKGLMASERLRSESYESYDLCSFQLN